MQAERDRSKFHTPGLTFSFRASSALSRADRALVSVGLPNRMSTKSKRKTKNIRIKMKIKIKTEMVISM